MVAALVLVSACVATPVALNATLTDDDAFATTAAPKLWFSLDDDTPRRNYNDTNLAATDYPEPVPAPTRSPLNFSTDAPFEPPPASSPSLVFEPTASSPTSKSVTATTPDTSRVPVTAGPIALELTALLSQLPSVAPMSHKSPLLQWLWVQLGQRIDGSAASYGPGNVLAISNDGSRVVVFAIRDSDGGFVLVTYGL